MYTGIIQEVGKVSWIRRTGNMARIRIETKTIADPVLGESIAVNGTCLTVAAKGSHWFEGDITPKTWECTNLSLLRSGDPVNIERSLQAGDSMGGHMVSGHVDGMGEIASIRREENAVFMKFTVPETLTNLMVYKGSVAVDGVSLTIQALEKGSFLVSLIPHTYMETRFPKLSQGAKVNIETDMMAKHAVQAMQAIETGSSPKRELTLEFLQENGFA